MYRIIILFAARYRNRQKNAKGSSDPRLTIGTPCQARSPQATKKMENVSKLKGSFSPRQKQQPGKNSRRWNLVFIFQGSFVGYENVTTVIAWNYRCHEIKKSEISGNLIKTSFQRNQLSMTYIKGFFPFKCISSYVNEGFFFTYNSVLKIGVKGFR